MLWLTTLGVGQPGFGLTAFAIEMSRFNQNFLAVMFVAMDFGTVLETSDRGEATDILSGPN